MGKKVVGIIGSYRRGRVVDTAVKEVLRGAEGNGAEAGGDCGAVVGAG